MSRVQKVLTAVPAVLPFLLFGVLRIVACRPLFYWNETSSMPEGVYIAAYGRPHPGDVVVLASRVVRSFGLTLPKRLLKRFAYGSGNAIRIDRAGLFAGGKLVAPRVASFGVRYTGTLPKGRAVVLGEDARSFDSRYFGPVRISSLAPVTPLVTWGAR